MRKSPVVVTAIFVAMVATVAFGQPPGDRGPRGRMMDRREHLKQDLHLTDQQESQVKKLHLALERKQAQVRSRMQLARLDMREMYLSDKLDRSAIEKTVKEVSALQEQIKLNFVDFWFSVNGVLTPEQQKTWKDHLGEMAGQMRERMRGRMEHRGPRMYDPPDVED